MCNLDKIYALLVLESITSEGRVIASQSRRCRQPRALTGRDASNVGGLSFTDFRAERIPLSRFLSSNSAVILAPEEQH